MAALPTLLLLISAGLTGLLRSRRPLWWSATAAVGICGCLLTFLLLESQLPLATELSVWRPVSLFGQGLLLNLGDSGWGIAFAVCGLLLAIVLSQVGQANPEAADLGWALALAAFALMGAMAGNLLTLIIAWSLIGACRLAWWILAGGQDPAQGGLVRLGGQEMAAPLLLMLAAYLDHSAAGAAEQFNPVRSDSGALLYLLAITARAAPLGTARSRPDQTARSRPGLAAFQLLPPAAALATLGGVDLSAMPPAAAAVAQWMGLLTFAAAAFGWAVLVEREAAAGWLAWALSGLGLMLASTGVPEGVQAVTALVLLLGGLQSIVQVVHPWQRLWPALAFLAAAGVPASPGAGLAAALGQHLPSGELRWVWIVVAVGMAVIAAGVALEALGSGGDRISPAGSRVRGTDLAGIALVAASLVVSVRQGWIGGGSSLALPAGVGPAALALAWWASRRRPNAQSMALPALGASRVGSPIDSAASAVLHGIAAVAALFEGRAGLLWMFLVLLAAWLAVQA